MMVLPGPYKPTVEPYFLRPLLVMAMGVMIGITLGAYGAGGFYPLAGVAIGLCAVCGWLAARGRTGLVLPIALSVMLGHISIQPWLRQDLAADHVARCIDRGQWQVVGRVAEPPDIDQDRGRFVLEAQQVQQGANLMTVTGRIIVSTIGPLPNLQRGDTVGVNGQLRAIRSFCNPGGFDYERFMALQAIHVRLFVQGPQIRCLALAPQGFFNRVEKLRRSLLGQMQRALAGHDADAIAILKALTLGDRVGISAGLQEAFNRSGVTHVLSISGLHIGMVAVVGFGAGFWVLAWIPFLRQRGWVHRAAALVGLLLVLGYGGVSGWSAATQRAVLMTAVFLLTYWVGRRHDGLNTLAVAALVILIVHPPALFMVSFQLSFAAVATMLVGMRARLMPLQRAGSIAGWRRWAGRLQASVWISLLAILGTLPLVLRYFNLLPLFGPLTNLVVVPLTGLVVVPLGLLGILCLPASAWLAGWCWKVAAVCLVPQNWLIEKIAAWPWAALHTITPSGVEMALFYLALGLGLLWKRWGRWRWAALVLTAVLIIADAGYWAYSRFGRRTLTVTAVDVGQGSATLLELPGGYTALIDGGGFGDTAMFDTGARIVAPLLWRKKIASLDLVVLTHPDSDHLNGLLYLLRAFTIGQVWSTQEPVDSAAYRLWRQTIAEKGIDHPDFSNLAPRFEHKGAVIEVLGPERDFLQRKSAEPWRDTNADAMVLRASVGAISVLLPADITARAEENLLSRYSADRLASTILFVPHHGSRGSTTRQLLQAVRPAEAVISVGWHNRYHFPHPTILDRLRAGGSRIWRTDTCGAIQIDTDGQDYHITTCRSGCP